MSDRSRLDELIECWEQWGEQDDDVTAEELCRDDPELLEPLRRRINGLRAGRALADRVDPGLVTLVSTDGSADEESQCSAGPVTVAAFATSLVGSGLLSAAEVSAFRSRLGPGETPDAALNLARLLVAEGKLTDYQATTLVERKNAPLLIDRYIILDTLDSGGMGLVFKAVHRKMDRIVALKILAASMVDSPENVRRFQREVRAAATLSHPNIVTAYDADEYKGTHFLVMEYVPGRNLARVVREDGPLPVAQALDVLIQASRGLEHAHRLGIVHRDIKPANLVLASGGTVKLLDMGVARFLAPARRSGSRSLTRDGLMMGTVAYMPPEQGADAKHADARSDIYSLGCTLHYFLTGSAPYTGNAAQLLMAHHGQAIPELRHVRGDVPAGLDEIFRRMLAKAPADRYQTASDLLGALEAMAASLRESGATTPPATEPGGAGSKVETLADLLSGKIDFAAPSLGTAAARREPARQIWIGGLLLLPALALLGFLFSSSAHTRVQPPAAAIAAKPSTPERVPSPSGSLPESSQAEPVLRGIIPLPARFPGVPRWQVETLAPRTGVLAVCWSPDSRLIACATFSGEIRIYDASTFELAGLLIGHEGRAFSVAWSPDGKQIASGGVDGTVRLWSADGTPGIVLKACTKYVTSVAWRPDGAWLASGDIEGKVCLWHSDGAPGPVLKGHSSIVLCVAWSRDGQRLASTSHDKTVRLWRSDGTADAVLQGHTEAVRAVAWSSDGTQLASAGYDRTVRLWRSDGTPAQVLLGHTDRVEAVAWSPDGSQFATAGSDQTLRFWNADGRPGPVRTELRGQAQGLAWSPDGTRLASSDWTGQLRIWAADGFPGPVYGGDIVGVWTLAWIDDGASIAAAGADRVVRLWTGDGTLRWACQRDVVSLAWDSARKSLTFAGPVDTIGSIKSSGALGGDLGTHQGANVVAWAPGGTRLASGGLDHLVRLWEPDGTPGPMLEAPWVMCYSVSWSPDGRLIAASGDDRVVVWTTDQTPQRSRDSCQNPGSTVWSVAWSPDGKWLAIGNSEAAWLWSPNGSSALALGGSDFGVWSMSWSPDGSRLVAGGHDGTVRLWDQDGRPGPVLPGDRSEIHCVAWSPRGGQIAAGTWGGTIRFWDAATGAPQQVILLLPEGRSATFSPTGKIIGRAPPMIDKQLVYCLETPTGRLELLRPGAFRQRITGQGKRNGAE